MSNPVDGILSHYGKKGMKWGVRKGQASATRTLYSKAPKQLSDLELGKRIKRMETEKRYNQLNKKDVSDGKKLAAEILAGTGRRVATTVLTGASLVAIKAALTSQFGEGVGEAATRRLK